MNHGELLQRAVRDALDCLLEERVGLARTAWSVPVVLERAARELGY